MKFGKTDNLEGINLLLPPDDAATATIFSKNDSSKPLQIFVGCAKWNRQDLKNFYPRGTKDELTYYSTQFNSIELNATFYNMPKASQVVTWRDKTPDGFKFFPKITQSISHMRRLNDVQELTDMYCDSIVNFEDKLGMVFLQVHDNFGYKNFEKLVAFVENFSKAIPLAVEMRNTEWFNDRQVSSELYSLFEANHITNVLVDTAGRRDLLHMRMTTPYAFIRYVGANDPVNDRKRLNDWVERLKIWVGQGLRDIYFFVHQNIEMESPLLSAGFIEQLNKEMGVDLKVPQMLSGSGGDNLFS